MSEELPPWARESAAERVEAAATRRRWVTLAEIVGVAGLVIAALSLWIGWSDRRADIAERQAEKASDARTRGIATLTASVADGGGALVLKDAQHDVQSIDVRLPAALGLPAHDSLAEPRIEAKWFADAILKLTDGGADTREGRLPVLIAASWWDGDRRQSGRAIYDIVWKTQGRILRGRTLRLEGLRLRERSASPDRVDAIWAREKP